VGHYKSTLITKIEEQWGDNDSPITFEFSREFGPVRFLFFRLLADNYFHLGAVQIFEETYVVGDLF
jgi:hypothetical protein